MERRKFIKQTCAVCILGMAGLITPGTITAVAGKGHVYKTKLTENNEIIIPLSLFTETEFQIVRVKGWDYDLGVQKMEDGTYLALLMRCTHMENSLHKTSEGFICNMHGSLYDQKGEVLKGPAEQPMTKYTATINQDNLVITQ